MVTAAAAVTVWRICDQGGPAGASWVLRLLGVASHEEVADLRRELRTQARGQAKVLKGQARCWRDCSGCWKNPMCKAAG